MDQRVQHQGIDCGNLFLRSREYMGPTKGDPFFHSLLTTKKPYTLNPYCVDLKPVIGFVQATIKNMC